MENNSYLDIDSVESVSLENYLSVDIRSIIKKEGKIALKPSIDKLWSMGRAIEAAINEGFSSDKLNNIPNYYFEALKWLKGQEQTNSWDPIAPITLNGTDDDSLINRFNTSWMNNFETTFFQSAVLTNYYFNNRRTRTSGYGKNLNLLYEDLLKTLKEESSNIEKNIHDKTKNLHESNIQEYKNVVAIKEWQKLFEAQIKPGDKVNSRINFFSNFRKSITLRPEHSYFDQMRHYSLWKNIWLLMFVFGILFSIAVSAELNWSLKSNLAEILSLKIAVTVLFGTLFVSANKNYRIYANLYDQTKVKDVASKTIQGILLDEGFGEEERRILLAIAAQTLFEMKPNGHLTKKEASSPVSDLLVSLVGRKD